VQQQHTSNWVSQLLLIANFLLLLLPVTHMLLLQLLLLAWSAAVGGHCCATGQAYWCVSLGPAVGVKREVVAINNADVAEAAARGTYGL
jgi:hypothetical protein